VNRKLSGLLVAATLALGAAQASAEPITYIFDVQGVTGTLAGAAFTGANLRVELVGDTDNAVDASFNSRRNTNLAGNFTLSGFGQGTFLSPLTVYSTSSLTGFRLAADYIYVFSGGHDLVSEVGPLTGLTAREQNQTLQTDLGALRVTGTTTAMFQASFPQEPGGTVPLPATLLLLVGGAAGLLASSRKREG
jgi:hypothetical protein